MNKILSFLILLLFFSCSENSKNTGFYTLDNPSERVVWEKIRLMDPSTGEIPNNIRKKEMMFAQTLPKSSSFTKSSWIHRGPYNVGGRTRALAMDVLDENILFAGGASGGMFRSVNSGQSWDMVTKPNQLHNVTCVSQDIRSGKENIWYFFKRMYDSTSLTSFFSLMFRFTMLIWLGLRSFVININPHILTKQVLHRQATPQHKGR